MTTFLDEEVVLYLARAVDSSIARMTEALAGAFRVGIEVPQRTSGTPYSQVVDDYITVARDLLPVLPRCVQFRADSGRLDSSTRAFRQHLSCHVFQAASYPISRSRA